MTKLDDEIAQTARLISKTDDEVKLLKYKIFEAVEDLDNQVVTAISLRYKLRELTAKRDAPLMQKKLIRQERKALGLPTKKRSAK